MRTADVRLLPFVFVAGLLLGCSETTQQAPPPAETAVGSTAAIPAVTEAPVVVEFVAPPLTESEISEGAFSL